jgi:quercetin dioxygenase-like cupin family protein
MLPAAFMKTKGKHMRIALASILLLGTAIAASAQTGAAMKPAPAMAMKPFSAGAMAMKPAATKDVAAPNGAAAPLQTFDVPMSGKPQTVYILKRVFVPGDHIGFHTHDGVEITQVLYGTIELAIKGQKGKIYHAGDSFIVPRGTIHDPINVGKDDAAVAVTYVLDKGAPLKVMAK